MAITDTPELLGILQEKGWVHEPSLRLKRDDIARAIASLLEHRHVVETGDDEELVAKGAPLSTLSVELFGVDHPEFRFLIGQLTSPMGAVQVKALDDGMMLCSRRVAWPTGEVDGVMTTVSRTIRFLTSNPDVVEDTIISSATDRVITSTTRARAVLDQAIGRIPALAGRRNAILGELKTRFEEQLALTDGSDS